MVEEIPFDIIITKIDKTKQKDLNKNLKAFKQELKSRGIMIPEFFLSSGTK